MPASQYTDPAKRVLASAPYLQMPLWGITLYHPEFSTVDQRHWLINRPIGRNLTLEGTLGVQWYDASSFQIVLPKIDGKGQQDLQLSLQNVDRVIVDELELAITDPTTRIEVTLRLFLEDDATAGPQNVPLTLSLAQVAANSFSVSGTAGRFDVLNRVFPSEIYRIVRWPGLDR